VGRILRVKHAAPLVIDIIDPQDVFRSQWLKRQTYYIKQRYRIIMTDTEGYYKNKWTVKYEPAAKSKMTGAATEASAASLAHADIIEIDEDTGVLSVTTESKMKSTIPKMNGTCFISLDSL
jgi:hypothetical protein